VGPVPDPLLLRKFGSAGNRTRNLWVSSQELRPLDHSGGVQKPYGVAHNTVQWATAEERLGAGTRSGFVLSCDSGSELTVVCQVPVHCTLRTSHDDVPQRRFGHRLYSPPSLSLGIHINVILSCAHPVDRILVINKK
jgi:hypothetical protein